MKIIMTKKTARREKPMTKERHVTAMSVQTFLFQTVFHTRLANYKVKVENKRQYTFTFFGNFYML